MTDRTEESTSSMRKEAKMQVLEQIMKSQSSITCSSDNISMCDKYYEAIENLTTICHTDPNFSHVLCGTGLNHLPLLFHLRDTESPDIIHFAQPQPVQKMLYVHRHSIILQDTQTQWKKKCPLLFYLSGLECSRADHTKIFLSSRTHGQMMRGALGIHFSDLSTTVLEDEHGTMKFFLSSQNFQESFDEQTPNFLCAYRPVIGAFNKSKLEDPSYRNHGMDQKEIPISLHPTEIYALKSIPAIFHPEWPRKAFEFLTRQRPSGWPSLGLVQTATAQGCHLIPPSISTPDNSDEWQLSFDAAEKQLLQALSIVDKQASFLFQALICDRKSLNRGFITVEHIKTVILWTLEKSSVQVKDEHPLLTRFMQMCQEFLSTLASGFCCHYFVPEQNLFYNIPMQVLEDIRDMIDGLLDQPWTLVLHCHLLPYAFYDHQIQMEAIFFSEQVDEKSLDVKQPLEQFRLWSEKTAFIFRNQLQESLKATFHDTVRLYVLTACARLNDYSINESIILHRDVLRMVQDESITNKLYGPYVDIICTNLASLYHVKALTVAGKREREYFLIKAEAMMRQSKQMDLCLGRTRLANLLYSTNRFPEATQELDELLVILDEYMTNDVFPDESDSNDEQNEAEEAELVVAPLSPEQFSSLLWEKWLQKKFAFDIIYNRTLRPMCPSVMKRSVSLSMCSTLGIQRHSVAVFSPIFHGRFLLALCHSGMRDNEQALPILLGLESVLFDKELVKTLETSSYSEINEKQIAAYYIVLGNCYLAIDDQEKAKGAFRKAMKVFPGPRNPATLLYLSVRYGDTISGVQQGAKALAVASALSITYNYVSSHF